MLIWKGNRTRLRLALLLLLLANMALVPAICGFPASSPAQETGSAAALIVQLRIDGAVEPMLAEYITDGIDQAERLHAALVLITMNTPGGIDLGMRDIIQKIMASPVPVAVFVAPSGARAASAGFFILLSADVAAMAPSTDTGASSPIFMIGGSPVKLDETIHRKAMNEAAAYIRSIATKRGRNVQLAELAVTEAKAFTEKEALDGRLIDLEANSVEDLLAKLNGRTIKRVDGSTTRLDLSNTTRTALEMTAKQRWLSRLAQPDLLFILVILGILGLYIEFSHPGLILPGAVGAVCLILALVAMQILPVNAIGVLLILLAIGFFILEAKYTSYGLLGLGGAIAMLLGALLLIRSPITGAGVSLGTALGVTIPFALLAVFLMRLVLRSFRWKQTVGAEEMVGALGQVTAAIEGAGSVPVGQVFVHGEIWRAASEQQIPKGTHVRVVKVDGLTVHVRPAKE